MSFDWSTVGEIVSSLGIIGILAVIIIGGFKGWYVWGHQYRAMKAERDYWRDIAVRALRVGEAVVERVKPPNGGDE